MKNNKALTVSLACSLMAILSHAEAQEPNKIIEKTEAVQQVAQAKDSLTSPLMTEGSKDLISEQEEDRVLPFFGKEARERGYELPEPFGVNVNYMHIKQDIVVEDIKFSGIGMRLPVNGNIFKWAYQELPSNMFEIGVKSTKQKSHTETLRLDAWVFPFMNVYGVFGRTKGHSVSKISVSSPIPFVKGVINGMGGMDDLDFVLKFKGKTYGGGVTLAGGYGNWFGLLDMNYTKTKLDIITGNIKAFTLAPRVGYRFKVPGIEAINFPEGKLSLWVGTMYQDVTQNFNGRLSNLQFSPKLQGLISAVDSRKQGEFHVKQHLKSPWNMLVGARYEVGKHFDIISEIGFNKRQSFFLAGEFRF